MNTGKNSAEILERLFATIESRRGSDPGESYTAQLLAEGLEKICQKLNEEVVETIAAARSETPQRLASESADLLYHLLVLWAAVGMKPGDVWAELARREGTSGLTEKATRGK